LLGLVLVGGSFDFHEEEHKKMKRNVIVNMPFGNLKFEVARYWSPRRPTSTSFFGYPIPHLRRQLPTGDRDSKLKMARMSYTLYIS
jgi:hypothetical protein